MALGLSPAALDELAEDAAIEALKKVGMNCMRDEKAPGRPVTFATICQNSRMTDADLVHLRAFKHLERLRLWVEGGKGITDEGVAVLATLKTLKWVSIYSRVTDKGLAALKAALPGAQVEGHVTTLPVPESKPAPAATPTAAEKSPLPGATARTGSAPASFKAEVGDGSVRLLAVARHPPEAGAWSWWQPDGSRWTEGPFETHFGSGVTDATKDQRYEFVVRTAGVADDVGFGVSEVIPVGGKAVAGGNAGPIDAGPTILPGIRLREYVAAVPMGTKTATLRIGVAVDPWKTLAAGGKAGSTSAAAKEGSIIFAKPTEAGGAAEVVVSHSVTGQAVRVVAVDAEGKEYTGTGGSVMSSTGLGQVDAKFAGLGLAQIKEFRFQARPYRWVEFRDVSLGLNAAALDEEAEEEAIEVLKKLGMACVRDDKAPGKPVTYVTIGLCQISTMTDADLVHLKAFKHLERLNLLVMGKGITDAGVETLKTLKTLKWVSIRSHVTAQGAAALKAALPGAEIENVTLPAPESKPAPAATPS